MLDAGAREFHVKEFQALRDEILQAIREGQFYERVTVVGPIVAYAWLISNSGKINTDIKNDVLIAVLWYFPLLFATLTIRRAIAASRHILNIAEYLREMENHLAYKPLGGWEHHIHDSAIKRFGHRPIWDRLQWANVLLVWIFISTIGAVQTTHVFDFVRPFFDTLIGLINSLLG